MITGDKKEDCLKSIQNAYHSLKIYQGKKEKEEDGSDFVQTAFGGSKYAIVGIAQLLNLKSEIKDEIESNSKKNRDRREKIEKLENELSKDMVPEEFQENVKELFTIVQTRWQKEGFSGLADERINSHGDVNITFKLKQLEARHELLGNKELREQFDTLKETFYAHNFEILKKDSRTFLIDSKENREKLFGLIQTLYPGIEIGNIELMREDGVFVLYKLQGIITNTARLEG